MNKHLALTVVITLLVACAPQTAPQALGGGSGDPVSWFDAPLPGTIVDPGSPDTGLPAVQLVSHHSDPSGIAELEFSVNGEEVESNPGPPDGGALVTDTRDWTPPGPGEFQLQVRAMSNDGTWGNYAETYVIVPNLEDLVLGGIVQGVVYADLNGNGTIEAGEDPLDGVDVYLDGCGPQQIQTTAADGAFDFQNLLAGSCTLQVLKGGWGFSGSTPSIGYPVPVASDPNLPTALSLYMAPATTIGPEEPGLSERGLDTFLVYTGSCAPNRVNFSIRAVHPDGIRGVTFFFRLRNANGDTTPWSSGDAMSPQGNDYYALSMTGNHLESDSGFTWATVLYQFVIEPIGGESNTFIRSQVFSDLTLVACGEAPPPPPPPPPGPTPYPCLPYPSCLVH